MSLLRAGTTPISLPSGRVVDVPLYQREFAPWEGDPSQAPRYNANSKPVVSLESVPMFPELAVLRELEASGWSGVLIDNFGQGRFLREWGSPPVPTKLDQHPSDILLRIPLRSGRWDIFAWRGDDVLFAELKGGKDRIRPSQRQWLEAALDVGFDLSQFALVEWTIRSIDAKPN